VVESGMLTDIRDRYTATGPVAPVAIPASLQASLLARLDRLAPVREVAQIGAVLGRQFSHELISAVALMPQPQLDDALARRIDPPPRHSTRRRINVQARLGAVRRLQHLAAQPPAARFLSKPTIRWREHKGLKWVDDRDRGTPRGATPPTPPGIRVTYHGGSTGLSLDRDMESGEAERVEVAVGQCLLDRRMS
jgi:hypothetical protein